jgi:hypothetical protein
MAELTNIRETLREPSAAANAAADSQAAQTDTGRCASNRLIRRRPIRSGSAAQQPGDAARNDGAG